MNIPIRTRTAFHSQPAQHLLIDVGNPMTPEILRFIIEAVANVITLANSMYGGVRVPEFGMSFININYCNVLQFVHVRGNLPKINKSFKSLEDMVRSNEKSTFQHFIDNLKFAICKILEEYGSKHNVGSTSRDKPISQFVVITIVTLRDGSKIQEYLEDIVKSFSIEKLKKIHILQITESINNLTKIGVLVDHTQITLNSFKLEQFFKLWLLDCDTSQEHICIHFNNCNNKKHIPVYNLTITKRISGSGVCESLLFGLPQKLSPTKCWQLEGNDSTINQLNFYALCKQLLDKNEYLLAMSTYSQENISMPGHYILIPGKDTLLLRAVASSELVLPNRKIDLLQTNNELSQNIRDNIDITFNELPLIEDFTPDTVSSNLYLNLKSNFSKKMEWNEEVVMKNSNVDHPALDSQRTKLCLTRKRRLL
ncbi:hypothetical protein R5R35_009250 [Gryllus longicercus]|uniref:Uncharacterized protein n=1 Tax=Gryllus longicercus TaxID=2509291 RepID=A0AAN9VIW0_9ORTH